MTEFSPPLPKYKLKVILTPDQSAMAFASVLNKPKGNSISVPKWAFSDCDCSDCDCSDCACPQDAFLDLYTPSFHLSTPVIYALELTPVCNNHCPGCGNAFIDEAERSKRNLQDKCLPLALEGWKNVLDRLAPHAGYLKITGGEPTVHPQFQSIIREVAKKGIPFTIFTNGRWQNPERMVEFLAGLPECRGLLISLHGNTSALHEGFTNAPGSFQQTIANIRLATQAGIHVATSTVISRYNYDQINAIIDLSNRLGAEHAVFKRYLGLPVKDLETSNEQLCIAVQSVETAIHNQWGVKWGNCLPECSVGENTSSGCLAGIAYCAIDPWGNLRPCAHDPLICGNVLEKPVKEIWEGPELQSWRAFIPENCTGCSILAICRMGCKATALLNGNVETFKRISPKLRVNHDSSEISLFEGFYPIKKQMFTQDESFGEAWVNGNKLTLIPERDLQVVAACDGGHTLKQIDQKFGAEGLNTIGYLLQHDLIELSEK